MNTNRPFITRHALQRCREMGVDRNEVVEAIVRFESRYPSHPSYGSDRHVSVGGRLAIVHTATLEVITVLWAGRESRGAAA